MEKFLDTEVKYYSSGMFLRLAFSVAVHTDPDVFLVDEILAVGDPPFRRKCIERIQQLSREGRTLVVVSHDLPTVREVCTRGIVLEQGRKVEDGPLQVATERVRQG
jgi:ABC-2 type transport system ATP-binding protein